VKHAPRWPTSLAVVVVLGVQLTLPERVALGPTWLVPAVQAVLLAPLIVANPIRLKNRHPFLGVLALTVAYVILGTNLGRLVHLVVLIGRGQLFSPGTLILAALVVLVVNVVGMAVLFWELDRGGPEARDPLHDDIHLEDPDLQFPQDTMDPTDPPWRPEFLDYLFVAFTATTAFSPTDTMPLSRSFKVLFMLAAVTSMTTIAVIAARAVNLV